MQNKEQGLLVTHMSNVYKETQTDQALAKDPV